MAVLRDLIKGRRVRVFLNESREGAASYEGVAEELYASGDGSLILLTDVITSGGTHNYGGDIIVDTRSGGFVRLELMNSPAKK